MGRFWHVGWLRLSFFKFFTRYPLVLKYRFTPKTTHVSTMRILNLKCPKSQALLTFCSPEFSDRIHALSDSIFKWSCFKHAI
jgi:hypothetical protein